MHRNINRCDRRARHPDLYTAPGAQAIEDQAVGLLVALVAGLHPDAVLEVGTWRGHTARALASALRNRSTDQYRPHLDVVDLNPVACQAAKDWLDVVDQTGDPVTTFTWSVHCKNFHAWRPPAGRRYDVALVDADWNNREQEYDRTVPLMQPGGIIAVHDTGTESPGRNGTLYAAAKHRHPVLDLPYPRGLVITQVPW